MRIKDCVIFGGTGFVGGYFLRHLLQHSTVDSIVIADLRPPSENPRFLGLQSDFRSGRVRYVEADLRRDLSAFPLPSRADLIVNLAALSRDTGFSDEEYFQTNVRGAENVCAWADHVCASRILFTSSSFSYGFCVEPKDESALQVPTTPYGVSKLVAEKIYLAWQAASPARRLLLVRPGIIFGEGEAGNVTRLLHALQRGYFFYGGNRQTLKPGGYVKELCHALMWGLQRQDEIGQPVFSFNFSFDPVPTVEMYVDAIRRVEGIKRSVPNFPKPLLVAFAYLVQSAARALGLQSPITPARVQKLARSIHMVPGVLRQFHYEYQYTLDEGFQDWKQERTASRVAAAPSSPSPALWPGQECNH